MIKTKSNSIIAKLFTKGIEVNSKHITCIQIGFQFYFQFYKLQTTPQEFIFLTNLENEPVFLSSPSLLINDLNKPLMKHFPGLRHAYYTVLGNSSERFEGMKVHDSILLGKSGLILQNAESDFSLHVDFLPLYSVSHWYLLQ